MIWIILICLNCDVDAAREQGWRAEAALSSPAGSTQWRREDQRAFASQRECMRALRREHPERDWSAPDEFGQINKTIHHPDYVEEFSSIPLRMNGEQNIACFSQSSLAG